MKQKKKSNHTREARIGRKRSRRLNVDSEPSFSEMKPRVDRAIIQPVSAMTEAQGQYISSIKDNIITFGVGPAGTGKAQPLDALIKTPNGWSQMRDMTVGSAIVAKDGTKTSVTAVFPQGSKDIYTIKFKDGREARCCREHLWRVYCYDWKDKWRVINTEVLIGLLAQKSKEGRLYIDLPDSEDVIDSENLPVDPYLLGLLLGDGHIGRNCIRLSTGDDFIVEQVRGILPSELGIFHVGKFDYSIVKSSRERRRGNNSLLSTLRDDLGMCGIKSDMKFVPDVYLHSSTSQRLSILQGLMDSDGTVCKNSGSLSFTSVSEGLAMDVQYLVRSLGGLASISEKEVWFGYDEKKKKGKNAFNVNIRMKTPSAAFRLPRKIELTRDDGQYKGSLRLGIVSVEKSGCEEAQCISIKHGDSLYVTNDFVVTHNTYVAAGLAADDLRDGKIDKIIITRPGVEAGESFGFLPGEIEEKYAPYIDPFRDILNERLGKGQVEYLIKSKKIEAKPLAFMRGSTFKDAVIILDEAQNTTPTQMKLFLTRIGEGCTVIVDGDTAQKDISGKSGLSDAVNRLRSLSNVGVVEFHSDDIVRSGIVKDIIEAYEE